MTAITPMTDAEVRALKLQAEDVLIWQDQWDVASSDGTAVGDWLDTVSPELILRLIARLDQEALARR